MRAIKALRGTAALGALSFLLISCAPITEAPIPEISSWAYVDSSTVNGINKNPNQSVQYPPQLVEYGGKLYAAWSEPNGAAHQIRVAVYNGNDVTPTWTFVDGNGTTGINKDSSKNATFPQCAVFGSKLYVTWSEPNATADQIRVAVYNGNDAAPSWAFVDGNGTTGINKDNSQYAESPMLAVFDAKLYAAWQEIDSGLIFQIRVAVYNGNDGAPSWTFVDANGATGINKNTSEDAQGPRLAGMGGKLYGTWWEFDGAVWQIRAAVFNGKDAAPPWSFVDGNGVAGLNKDPAKDASLPQLTSLGQRLYATWYEKAGAVYQVRVAVYNGDDAAPGWTFVDGNTTTGINKDPLSNATGPQITVHNDKLYATWAEGGGSSSQIRVAVYDGSDGSPSWAFVDGNGTMGINKDPSRFAAWPQLTEIGSKLYATWQEYNGTANQVRVAVGQ